MSRASASAICYAIHRYAPRALPLRCLIYAAAAIARMRMRATSPHAAYFRLRLRVLCCCVSVTFVYSAMFCYALLPLRVTIFAADDALRF